ncbi:hypothetical protein [Nocardia otitidiscaviarum]|uniref:hypothetical protein n=1 Tax=Nocardia otitidiscaviarum TaxID=1823 RepID=UPI002458E2EA|nr:hypothetical protein [Nocardia otitidiscaviarum]
MSPRQRVRTVGIAVCGAAILVVGPGLATAATAHAAPGLVLTAPANPNYPLGSDPGPSGEPKKDKNIEKAENLGGGLATKVIDTIAGVAKCGISFALDSVKCKV